MPLIDNIADTYFFFIFFWNIWHAYLLASLQITPDHIQLQINGEIVGARPLSSLLNKESSSSSLNKLTLAYVGGDGNIVQGYVHNLEVLPLVSSIKDYPLKVIIYLVLDTYFVVVLHVLSLRFSELGLNLMRCFL